MTTHLVLRVGDGPWQSADVTGLDGDELAVAISGLDGVTATVGDDGLLVLATEETGETTTLEVDPEASTAVLGWSSYRAAGQGPGHATLTGSRPGPYAPAPDAAMTLHVDGKSRKVTFDEEDHGEWSADDVAARINRQLRRKVAHGTGDGRVRITSPTQGVGSRLEVTGPEGDVPDAAELLGFTGDAARDDPYRTEPARLICRPAAEGTDTGVVVENLTAAPLELQLPTGRSVLPARGRLVVTRDAAADGLLGRLSAQGTVRMSPERNS
ncbi:hypothetical protein [Winogradskya humida]|uniref:Late control gene D protein (GPD) n=1 Tax=Winogradskya humida TaxID=113566 RepID=A0ABQ3ZYG4_9ACTN|nr:hypothetical protein [Actinoplanes humidus]GIE23624.1 hypothetical protein Ahu01nite_067260 [Actinoplanes humidus]